MLKHGENGCVTVRGGNIESLVERLTCEKKPDGYFVYAFILTYRTFTKAETFLELLYKRYHLEYPDGLNEKQKTVYHKKKIIPVRLRYECIERRCLVRCADNFAGRVFNVLKTWVKHNFEDFEA